MKLWLIILLIFDIVVDRSKPSATYNLSSAENTTALWGKIGKLRLWGMTNQKKLWTWKDRTSKLLKLNCKLKRMLIMWVRRFRRRSRRIWWNRAQLFVMILLKLRGYKDRDLLIITRPWPCKTHCPPSLAQPPSANQVSISYRAALTSCTRYRISRIAFMAPTICKPEAWAVLITLHNSLTRLRPGFRSRSFMISTTSTSTHTPKAWNVLAEGLIGILFRRKACMIWRYRRIGRASQGGN